ncbi:hypothetical protein BC936DRAFT_147458 [Jimgerdemannia flammicorona]|uniref:Uncharacterized protein n=1 Tax=Jimgerdemannia flammicorona TaxID=994334 RepID=A0A433D5A1_9FUNG|nr:hypothetical protein BC936DRAFT_147458 [Jimgerdemannia flammicorona]RUP46010.1 hypothetical protein BC936DRAFT_147458 [Jimgerdemannia flammicorona]
MYFKACSSTFIGLFLYAAIASQEVLECSMKNVEEGLSDAYEFLGHDTHWANLEPFLKGHHVFGHLHPHPIQFILFSDAECYIHPYCNCNL